MLKDINIATNRLNKHEHHHGIDMFTSLFWKGVFCWSMHTQWWWKGSVRHEACFYNGCLKLFELPTVFSTWHYASMVYAIVMSVFVCHTLVLYQNG